MGCQPCFCDLRPTTMSIDRSGVPFIAAALVPGVGLALVGAWEWAAPFWLLGGFFTFFFRDPERITPGDPLAVVAPADGRVVTVAVPAAAGSPPGVWQQVSIFLSPLDVHVNRAPVSGRVTRVDYHPGRFLPAYRTEAATENERNELWLDHGGCQVVCRQVVGILARRVVCRVAPGAELRAGERFGIMKFGSRIDLFLPMEATIRALVGDRVRGGETLVAMLSEGVRPAAIQ